MPWVIIIWAFWLHPVDIIYPVLIFVTQDSVGVLLQHMYTIYMNCVLIFDHVSLHCCNFFYQCCRITVARCRDRDAPGLDTVVPLESTAAYNMMDVITGVSLLCSLRDKIVLCSRMFGLTYCKNNFFKVKFLCGRDSLSNTIWVNLWSLLSSCLRSLFGNCMALATSAKQSTCNINA